MAVEDLLIADGHVHAHSFAPGPFLDAAVANLERAAAGLADRTGARLPYLLLVETDREDFFERASRRPSSWGSWRIRPTAEPEALLAEDAAGRLLVLVAGQQIPTRRGLEVLAIGTLDRVGTGLPFGEALNAVLDSAALAVIPWGFGKWWGERGRLVERELYRAVSPSLFLGDNGGRLWWTPRPRLMEGAEARGVRILPGSDPLPFPDQSTRVGRAGFVASGRLDTHRPLAALVAALARGAPVRRFRDGERTLPFIRSQIRMQLHKRARKVS